MKINRGKPEPTGKKICIGGGPGVGKTTLACQFPNPFVMRLEEGLNPLIESGSVSADIARTDVLKTWAEVGEVLDYMINEEHDFRTLVIDSLDWLEPIVWDKTCEIEKAADIEEVGGGWQKGYTKALIQWRKIYNKLEQISAKNIHVIAIVHMKIKKVDDPTEATKYDKLEAKLHEKAAKMMEEFFDIVATAKITNVYKSQKGKDSAKVLAAGDRILLLGDSPAAMAKNRYTLPNEIPLDYNVLANLLSL